MKFTGKCKFCDVSISDGDRCNNCWEVSARIAGMSEDTLARILRATRNEFWSVMSDLPAKSQ
jgi:hypothetical protein